MGITTYQTATPVHRILLALTFVVFLSAFRHTDIDGYTDPAYIGYTFKTVVVQMPNLSLGFKKQIEKRLAAQFRKMKIKMLLHDDLFPPTRQWTEAASRAIYEQHDVDAGLIISLGSAGSTTTPGMVMYNATTVGGVTSGYATQTVFHYDNASFQIALVDADSKDTVWIGELDTRGAGLLFTGQKSTAKSLVKGLIKEWKSAGHLPGKR